VDLVTIGVPVYRGEAFLEEALRSIQGQTYRNLEVLIALDGPDAACERIVSGFLADSRFRRVVQPARLGWFGNLNWLMTHASGDFWIYHGQDDLTSENYVEALVTHARTHPEAALVHGDMISIGQATGRWEEPPVHGSTAFIRQMALMTEPYPGVAFHGLSRASALALTGGIPSNEFDNVATDIAWMAAVALSGELHRVEDAIYRKRFHGKNVSGRAARWPQRKRLQAWSAHCVNMMEQALRVAGTAHELRLLWLAAIARLAAPLLTGYLFDARHLTRRERFRLIDSFLTRARKSTVNDIPVLLDMEWPEIEVLSRAFYWLPRREMVEIVDFGPEPVRQGQPFGVQPDGSSAIWVRTSRRCEPGSKLRLDGVTLDTAMSNTLLTATVPEALTASPRELDVVVVRPDGSRRSPPARLEVVE
jgi:GT2 family glycosyltransferase